MRSENARLAFKLENRAIHVWLREQHRRVVREVASWEVVRSVEDDVKPGKDVHDVCGGKPLLKNADVQVRIEPQEGFARGVGFWTAEVGRAVQHLALQI